MMKFQHNKQMSCAFYKLSYYLPIVLLILSILGYVVLFAIGSSISLIINTSFILLPTFAGALFVSLNRGQLQNFVFSLKNNDDVNNLNLIKLFFLIAIILYVMFITGLSTNICFGIGITALYLILAIQIIYRQYQRIGLFLVELFLAICLLLLPPFFSGYYYLAPDFGFHTVIINHILSDGVLMYDHTSYLDSNIFWSYRNYQLYHIAVATSSLLFGLNINIGIRILFGLCFASLIFFSYQISRFHTKIPTIILLSLILFTNMHYVWRPLPYIAPYGFCSVYCMIFIGLVFLMSSKQSFDVRYIMVSLPIIAAILMSHHLQVIGLLVIIILILLVSILVSKMSGYKTFIRWHLPIILCASYLGYFYFFNVSRVTGYIQSLINELLHAGSFGGATTSIATTADMTLLDVILRYPHSLTIFFSIIGIFIILSIGIKMECSHSKNFNITDKISRCYFLGIFAILTLYMFVVGPLDVLSFLQNLNFSRFRMFFAPFISICIVMGILYVSNWLQVLTHIKIKNLITIGFLILFVIPSIAAYAPTNELISGTSYLNQDISKTEYADFLNRTEVIDQTEIIKYLPVGAILNICGGKYTFHTTQADMLNPKYDIKINVVENANLNLLHLSGYSISQRSTQKTKISETLYDNGGIRCTLLMD